MHRPAVHRYRAVIASEIVVIGKRREKRLGYPLQFTTASWVLHVAPGGRLVHAPEPSLGQIGCSADGAGQAGGREGHGGCIRSDGPVCWKFVPGVTSYT